MLSIFGERERPNLSAGCMSNAFRRRERNALPFSMVFVSASVHLLILRAYTVDDLQLQMKAYPSNHRTYITFEHTCCVQHLQPEQKLRLYVASRSHAFTHAWTTAYTRVVQLCTKSCNPIRLQVGETSRTRTFLRLRIASRLYTCTLYMYIHVDLHCMPGETGPR